MSAAQVAAFTLPFTHYASLGYLPVPIERGQKKPLAIRGWNNPARTWDYAALDAQGHSVGLLCHNIVGLDVDIPDEKHAKKIEQLVRKVLSLPRTTPRRVGRAPKCLLVARVASPVHGWDITQGRKGTLFQLLGEGKQFVVHGIHPDTHQPYTLSRALPKVDELPLVTPEKLASLREALVDALARLGYEVDSGGSVERRTGIEEQAPWTEVGRQQAWEALMQLDPDMPYPMWRSIGMALHEGTHGSEEGFEMFDAWSSTGTRKQTTSVERDVYDPSVMRTQWKSYGRRGGITRATLFKNDFPKRDVVATSTAVDKEGEVDDFMPLLDLEAMHANPPEPMREIIKDWLYEGTVSLFAGDGGTGKSIIGLQLAVHLALGIDVMGQKVQREGVLFYSCEDGWRHLYWRIRRICESLGRSVTDLVGWLEVRDGTKSDVVMYADSRGAPQMKHRALVTLANDVAVMQRSVVFIDNASDVFSGSEIVRAQVRAFIRSLQAAVGEKCSVVLLAHVNRETAKNPETSVGYSGSTAWNNSVRSRWYLYRNDDKATLTLELQKSNYGKSGAQFAVKYDDLAGVFVLEAAADKLATLEGRVLLALADILDAGGRLPVAPQANRSVRTQLIGKGIELSRDAASRMLNMLEKKGMVTCVNMRGSQGREIDVWALTESALKLVENMRSKSSSRM